MVFVEARSDLSVNFTSDVRPPAQGRGRRSRARSGFEIDAKGNDPSRIMAKHEVLSHARTTLYAMKNATLALSGSGHARRAIVLVSGFSPIVPPSTICADSLAAGALNSRKPTRDGSAERMCQSTRWILAAFQNDLSASRMNRGRAPCTGGVVAQQQHLVEIAESTGGRALINLAGRPRTQSTKSSPRTTAASISSAILPEPSVHDGKFHPITVKVNRPGAEVRARAGYVAASATTTPTTTQQTL